jgi:shikimate dehydrogenase
MKMKCDFEIQSSLKYWGLIGNKDIAQYSIAPKMWKKIFKEKLLDINYFVLNSDSEEEIRLNIQKIKLSPQVIGFNIARPWKSLLFEYCDWVEPVAKKLKTVNTIISKNGKFYGYNTDGIGIVNTIVNNKKIENSKVLIIGSGGATQTVPYYLSKAGASEIYLIDIINEKSMNLKNLYKKHFPRLKSKIIAIDRVDINRVLSSMNIIINATPCGMLGHNEEIPISIDSLNKINKEAFVVEMIYSPVFTLLLTKAHLRGCLISSGINMLIEQASYSFNYAFNTIISDEEKNIIKNECMVN